ncbi:MAG: signal domain/LPXTG anchor domain surface protein, partial [Thermoleophilia bacterium]|nr:signal domain/LPXTG anchor domain surface protein [Thermoleophilia bacterium]
MRTCPAILASLLTLLLGAPLVLAPSAGAVTGDYSVRLTNTSGVHWASTGRGPFITTPMKVYSGIGIFANADYKAWRATVPGDGAKIVGGTVSMQIATPYAGMSGRIIMGSGTATPTVLYDGDGDGTVNRTITGVHDWIQFDLRSTTAVTTKKVMENSVTMTSMNLLLHDSVPPTIAPTSLPAPSTWHGAGTCAPVAYLLQDQGGGMAGATITRADTGAVVASWTSEQFESPRPGHTWHQFGTCITAAQRAHGDTQFVAAVRDVGGRVSEHRFTVRADHAAPVIGGGPAEGVRLTMADATIEFTGEDSGAGIAHVGATLDGAPIGARLDGRRVILDTGQLKLGAHRVTVTLIDGAGNGAEVARSFEVRDVAAPTLTLDSPSARGDQRAWVSVRASDDLAGVDPTTWLISANGEPVTIHADAAHATATIGPLAPGMHRIDIRVADRSGNVATLAHAYDVVTSDVPSTPNIGTRSGVFVVDQPSSAVTYGATANATVYVARNGRPLTGQTVEVRRASEVLAKVTTDAQGVARAAFAVGAPGAYTASVAGLAFEPAPI